MRGLMPGLLKTVSAAADTTLTTLTHVKAEMDISDSSLDAALTALIGRASAVIATACGWVLGLQTYTETFRASHPEHWPGRLQAVRDGNRVAPMILSAPVINAVSSVTEGADAPLVVDTDYELVPDAGMLWRLTPSGSRRNWHAPVTVVAYSAGYVLPDSVPLDLEEACLSLVRSAFFARGADRSVVLDVSEGVGRTSYAPTRSASGMSIDDGVCDLIRPYRNRAW